jgi:polyhydroxyalkanoate synthesis regulator phasin
MPKLPSNLQPKMPSAKAPDWRRALETGMQFTEMRRSQARAIVSDLVAQGHLARDQMASAVDEVLDISRRRSDDLRKIVQSEVQRQLGALGLATKKDLVALERRVTKAARDAKKQAPKKAAATKKAGTKKKAAAKSTRKAG